MGFPLRMEDNNLIFGLVYTHQGCVVRFVTQGLHVYHRKLHFGRKGLLIYERENFGRQDDWISTQPPVVIRVTYQAHVNPELKIIKTINL